MNYLVLYMSRNGSGKFHFLLIFLAGWLLSAATAYCQNYIIKSYTTDDGLPHNNVRSIARDSTGFLWLGTWDGLSRFDGYEFRNFYHQPDDSTSLPFFSVFKLCVDRADNLWILTDTRELVRYNRNTEDFSSFSSLCGFSTGPVMNISTDEKGNLVIISESGLLIKDPALKKVRKIDLRDAAGEPYNIQYPQMWCTITDDSRLWLYGSTISEFTRTNDSSFVLQNKFTLERSHPQQVIFFDYADWYSLSESADGNTWIFTSNGLFRLDRQKGVFRECTADDLTGSFSGKRSVYWGSRDLGIFCYDPVRKSLTHIPEQRSKWFLSLTVDTRNSFWFSSISPKGVAQGISMVTFIPGYFTTTLIPSPDSTSAAVYSVIMDKYRNIWAGVRGFDHIVRISPEGSFTKIGNLSSQVLATAGHIRSLAPVTGGIWTGYFNELLQYYDYRTGKFTTFKPDSRSFRAIAPKGDGRLYIGTDKLVLYDPGTGKTEVLFESPEITGIFRIFPDTSGVVWCGMSESRILRYDPKTGEGRIIRVARGTSNVEDIVPGDNGDLWIALLGKGVCRYNTITGEKTYYTTSGGLSNNTTYSILRDRKGHIWVSTNHGISVIYPESGYIRIFNETDGINITEFNSGAKFISDDGEFFFGGMGGFIRFFPDSISLTEGNLNENRILINNLQVSGERRYLPGNSSGPDTIILRRGENNFHLSFSSTDFINSGKIAYRYKLSGTNKKWIETTADNRNINYTNLRPGWQQLIIEASGQNGEWSASKRITVRVMPAFYQTRIFRTLMPILFLLIIASLIIIYIRQVKQRERSKQDELKLQSLRSQMNPHFIFNSLNSINYFISNNDRLSANRYIADFSRLIRSILSNMGSNYIPFEDEISSLRDYLRIEHLRFSDKFDYLLDTSDIANMTDIQVCPGIVQPFIENAIWHGVRALENRKGLINIKFQPADNNKIRCIICDDGIGIEASLRNKESSNNHKPKGISIITERLLITGKITRTSYKLEFSELNPGKKETGTRVEVEIPAKMLKQEKNDQGISG